MKKSIFLLLFGAVSLMVRAQQADIPTIIVFPDDSWMNEHGYMNSLDNDGETERIPRYSDAFVQSRDLKSAILGVQKAFTGQNFPHEDLENLLKDLKRERAEELANEADGDRIQKGAMDELMQQARPDIRIDLDYSFHSYGPRKVYNLKLKAVDAYTNEQIAAMDAMSKEPTMDPVDLAIQKLMNLGSDDFCNQIKAYYKDLRDFGRQITVIFRVADGTGIDFLRDEIGEDGDTYNDFLHQWIRKHSVNKTGKKGRQTKNMCEFKNVRIPFFDGDEPTDPETWANSIRKAFRAETGIKITKGQGNTLGRVNFLVGE